MNGGKDCRCGRRIGLKGTQCVDCRRAGEAARRTQLLEDVEFLIGIREWPERIAQRVGYGNQRVLSRRMYELGRPDLGRYLKDRVESEVGT